MSEIDIAKSSALAFSTDMATGAKETHRLAPLIKVLTPEAFGMAQAALLQIKSRITEIREKKAEIVGPFQNAVKSLEGTAPTTITIS